ncbi:hypothetical protein [Flavobacterium hydrocarbonoxydans]|uniref:hypothetical protein n=1 Tax=Flavobacterium hydrocarbonoxydans TaxID=2683249 RepID=UPI001E32D45A|nr:hypothetical protein [Flavobacterium hydrocarbonoxydans]
MAGGFFPVNNTEVQVGTNNGKIGTTIDFENDLGFKKNNVSFTGSFEWRISKRSRLDFEYFYLDRSASKTLEKTIEFGDKEFDINTRVTAFSNNQIIRVAYGYAILAKPKYEAGLLLGAHVLLGDVGIRAEGQNVDAELRENLDFTAPLPDVGIWGKFVLGRRWGLYTNINYLALKIDNISGRIMSYNLSVLYNVTGNFSLVAGYTGLNFKVDVEKERLNGFFKWGYNGPTITAAYTFGKHVKHH